MSSLIVSNVSDGTLSIPTTYVTNGSAKAWVNFIGTGTIAARDSLNLSSLTDNGTGSYTVNFTSSFGATDYSVLGTGNISTSNAGRSVSAPSASTYLANAFGINCFRTDTLTAEDFAFVSAAAHGDLA
jgi:hypothetical protein